MTMADTEGMGTTGRTGARSSRGTHAPWGAARASTGRGGLEALEERFVTRSLSYGPYLFRHGLHAAVEPLERKLIAEGGIRATGLRWVGVLEAGPPG